MPKRPFIPKKTCSTCSLDSLHLIELNHQLHFFKGIFFFIYDGLTDRKKKDDLLLPYITKVVNTIKDGPKDAADMKDKLHQIQAIIHEVDRIAIAEEDNTVHD